MGRAEFALYAAATASAALFVVFRDLKAPFPFRSVLGLLSIALLAIAAILFASTFSSAPPTPENTPGSLNISALAWLSIMAFIASVVVAVIIFLIDLQVAEYDPRKVDEQQIEQLSKAVEKEA